MHTLVPILKCMKTKTVTSLLDLRITQDLVEASSEQIEMEHSVVFDEINVETNNMKKAKMQKANASLLAAFTKLSQCINMEDLFDDILQVGACIGSLDDISFINFG